MTVITTTDQVTVDLIESAGGDQSVIRAAQVSVVGANNPEDFERDEGLIMYLMREHHGSPFEHNMMTFYVKAPIFVFREHMRHRVGHSYNERSGRYSKLLPEFYLPNPERPLVNIGKPSKPEFAAGTEEQISAVNTELTASYQQSWDTYESLLNKGIATEVSRAALPVAIMSEMYVSVNARSLMNFLTLRTLGHPDASFISRPQQEISMVAEKMEEEFSRLFPITHTAFNKHGRIAP